MAGNLEFIHSEEIPSSVLTVNIDNVFSDKYDIYKVIYRGINQSTNVSNGIEGFRFINASGSVNTGNNYAYAVRNMMSNNSLSISDNEAANFLWVGMITDQRSDGSTSGVCYIYNPYNSSTYTFVNSQATGMNSSEKRFSKGMGVYQVAESVRGFQIYESNSSRSFVNGRISVYGVK